MTITQKQAKCIICKILKDGLGNSSFRDKFPEAWEELVLYQNDMADHLHKLVPKVTWNPKKRKLKKRK